MVFRRPRPLLLSLGVTLCLGACETDPPKPAFNPVVDQTRLPDLRYLVHYGDTVLVTTKADAAGACLFLEVQVNKADETALYGAESKSFTPR